MSHDQTLPYARLRLFLGMANVGFWVCLVAYGLYRDWPGTYFPTEPASWKKMVTPFALFFLGYIGLQAPFDWVGGYLLPKRFRRFYGSFSDFITGWLRGVLMQSFILVLIALILLNYHAHLMWIVLAGMLLLLVTQQPVAWIIGGFQSRGSWIWKSRDEAFTGGIVGFPGLQKIMVVSGRGQKLRLMDERRRGYLREMGLPQSGVIIALAFNLIGVVLISEFASHPPGTLAWLVEFSFWFTLWSFLGLLTLPSFSRPAVFAGDHALHQRGVSREDFAYYLKYDGSQAGEESRGGLVETIFHPVPSVSNRKARWGSPVGWLGGWHAARYAIYLSWMGLSLLNRAVHCNIGKPDVWVMLPSD